MLKKLVKYGNSNALILDKAILELLNIEEGSIIKIKTDGKSIIITPHEKVTSEKVDEPFTHNQANIEATVKESFKKYKDISIDEREKLEKEFQDLIKKHQKLSMQLTQNPDFLKEVTQMDQQRDTSSAKHIETYKALRNKFSPDLMKLENEIATWVEDFKKMLPLLNEKHEPMQTLSAQQQKILVQEFLTVHKKYNKTYIDYGELLNNPEYQHEAQLIAEKYNANKNSADYLREIDTLTYKYLPEFQHAKEELKAVAEKYAKNDTK